VILGRLSKVAEQELAAFRQAGFLRLASPIASIIARQGALTHMPKSHS
jgi:hypothetical protein